MKVMYGLNVAICIAGIISSIATDNFVAVCAYFSGFCGWIILYMKEK
jgi:hypothetical protein